MAFQEIVERVIEREGGYVNHPNDPGAETNMGISIKAHPKEDIKNLTKERAKEIYYSYYWIPSKAKQLPTRLQETYFDMAVNMGTYRAVKILQKACNSKGCKLVVDGKIGPKTMKASKKIDESRLRVYRILYYTDLVRRRKSLEVFIVGWIRRAMEA
tara:strand:+ start:1246 stop:1716 length:471 start_codon:yes stop_codon:yes gene_type:complete